MWYDLHDLKSYLYVELRMMNVNKEFRKCISFFVWFLWFFSWFFYFGSWDVCEDFKGWDFMACIQSCMNWIILHVELCMKHKKRDFSKIHVILCIDLVIFLLIPILLKSWWMWECPSDETSGWLMFCMNWDFITWMDYSFGVSHLKWDCSSSHSKGVISIVISRGLFDRS